MNSPMRRLSLGGESPALPSEDDQAAAENQMRQALGLPNTMPRREKDRSTPGVAVEHRINRHVPHVNSNRLQQAEQALASEQAAHQLVARTLRQAQETLLELETKLGHAELARHEANAARAAVEATLEAERALREKLEAELHALKNREAARAAEPRRAELRVSEPRPVEPQPAAPKGRRVAKVAPNTETPGVEDEDAEPVQWWVPGWRESSR